MTDWHVIQTKAGEENRARVNLEQQRYDCYLPLLWKRTTTEPLFPGYLFLRATGRYDGISGAFGVWGMIMSGGAPATLKAAVIDALKAREHEGALRLKEIIPRRYVAGDRLRVTSGIFTGYEGKVSDLSGPQSRVNLLLQYLGRETIISLDVTDVAAVR